MASWDTEGILRIRCPRIPGHPHDLSIGGRRRYPQDTAVSSGCHRYPEDTVSPGHHWYPQDTAVSPGYRRYPQDTVSQDTAVSWGHRILRTPPRVLGHGVPRIPPPVLGISRYPQDAPRVPRRQLAFSDGCSPGTVNREFEGPGTSWGALTLEVHIVASCLAGAGWTIATPRA